MKLLIVVLNYRVTELTLDCLGSLSTRIQRVPGTHVAVCENGTGADAAEKLRRAIHENGWGSWASLTVVHPNRGFTGGNNLVIRPALASSDPPEYILLLNADTLVRDGALEALVTFMDDHPEAGIAGSKMVYPNDEVQGSPFRFLSVGTEFQESLRVGIVSQLLRQSVVVSPAPHQPCRVDWVSGASMILRRTMLEQIGLLDEGLYTYFDDVDLCLRARRAGWETWFVPGSVVTHLEGRSTGIARNVVKRRPRYWFQARRRFFLKNHGPAYAALADAAFIAGFAASRVYRHVVRRPDGDPPHMLADFVRNSVFMAGFKVEEVENPALAEAAS
jgi:N-acetylglucosaminyl-diphospho-decaprenol L-rhamnosyltransferase